MKRYNVFVLVIVLVTAINYAQEHSTLKIGNNNNTINPNAILELESTTKGFLPPRMTYCERKNIASPATGLWIWCSDCGVSGLMQVFDGVNWKSMDGVYTSISTEILDELGVSSIGAYSLRKLRASYSGPVIRVLRSSDNTQQDIGFDVDGSLNQCALLAFVGSGNGFVTIWYDQSGNGRNATTYNGGDNRIVNNGVLEKFNGKAGIVSGVLSTTSSLLQTTIPTSTTTLTANAVSTMDSGNQDASRLLALKLAAGQGFYDDSNVNRGALFVSSSSNTKLTGVRAYATLSTATLSLGSKFTATTIYDGTNNTMYLNGIGFTPVASSGTFTQQAFVFFNGDYMNTRPYKGTTTEVILFNVALTNAQRQVLETNQIAYYSITP